MEKALFVPSEFKRGAIIKRGGLTVEIVSWGALNTVVKITEGENKGKQVLWPTPDLYYRSTGEWIYANAILVKGAP